MDKELLLGWGLFGIVVLIFCFLFGPIVGLLIGFLALLPGKLLDI